MGNTNKAMEIMLNLVQIAKYLEKGAFSDHSQLMLTIGDNRTSGFFFKHTKNDSRKREKGISYMTMVLHFQQQQNDNGGFRVF